MSQKKSVILDIQNLTAGIGDVHILQGVNLQIKEGEIHAIMGPNGSGKSTLSKIIAGHPAYSVYSGNIIYQGASLLSDDPEERAKKGIFLAFQYPVEIPGVNNVDFLRLAYNMKRKNQALPDLDPLAFFELVSQKLKLVNMDVSFLNRNVNEGFSGGEKKRNEILQMALLNPKFSILDETDSGLDVDALRVIANGINYLSDDSNAILLITHYQRLLDYITPDFVHIMDGGKIILTGDSDLAKKVESNGYEWIQSIV